MDARGAVSYSAATCQLLSCSEEEYAHQFRALDPVNFVNFRAG